MDWNPKQRRERRATATWKRKLRNEGIKKIRSETELIHKATEKRNRSSNKKTQIRSQDTRREKNTL